MSICETASRWRLLPSFPNRTTSSPRFPAMAHSLLWTTRPPTHREISSMNFVNGIAAVAALSIASTAFAQSPRAAERQVIALADTGTARIAPAAVSLGSYAGLYASNDGEAFVITNDE